MTNSSDFAADYLIDRRRLRRKLTFWRVIALLSVVAVILFAGLRYGGFGRTGGLTPHIARVTIGGVITGDRDTIKLIDDVAASRASAVILAIDSPGGTTTGAEKLYDALRRLAAKKPVVGVVGAMAASGAYIAALGSDRIFARGNSLVGSIGVLFEYPNVSKLLDTVGVHFESVKSSPLKAAPNGLEPTSPEARAALAALVADAFDWFKDLVRERRGMSDAELAAVADGRVFSGRQGIPLKLVDEIGGEREAIAWLERSRGVAHDLPVRDWRRGGSLSRLGLIGMAGAVADALGLPGLASTIENIEKIQQLRSLDGLLAVWQGPSVD
jgi:protease IV